jgi:CHASE1-domain containing sensor protein
MNEYISRLVALRTLFESANDQVTRSEFEAFAGRLFERHPGILRVAWLPRVNRKERAEYEAAAITDGISGYRIKSLNADGSITTRRRMTSTILSSFPPSRRPRWSMAWIMRRPPNGGRRSNARATTT